MRGAARIAMVVVALCTGGALALLLLPSALPTSVHDDTSLSFRPHPGARLPLATKFADESGREVPLGSYFTASPVILVLDYLRCTSLCGVTLRNLVGALGRLPLVAGRDYQVVAISIDPRDKPADAAAARAKYAGLLDQAGGAAGLHFLTGSQVAVRQIAETVGFPYRYDRLLDAYLHPAGFIIASPDGIISRYVEGVAVTSQELIGAFADAQQDRSIGPVERVLLFCHIQGAPLGRFTVPVLAAFMLADILAGFGALAIFVAIRRRTRRVHV